MRLFRLLEELAHHLDDRGFVRARWATIALRPRYTWRAHAAAPTSSAAVSVGLLRELTALSATMSGKRFKATEAVSEGL